MICFRASDNGSLFRALSSRIHPLLQQQRKIFVCRLSPDTTSQTLHQAFAEHGTVVEAVVIQDSRSRRSRGFGFVKFADVESAERALENPFKCACVGFQVFI